MRNSQLLLQAPTSNGDAAGDGLFSGAVAGAVMVICLVVIGILAGGCEPVAKTGSRRKTEYRLIRLH